MSDRRETQKLLDAQPRPKSLRKQLAKATAEADRLRYALQAVERERDELDRIRVAHEAQLGEQAVALLELARLREALEFYAAEENWERFESVTPGYSTTLPQRSTTASAPVRRWGSKLTDL